MPTQATSGYKTTLGYATLPAGSGGLVYTVIAEITDVKGPGMKAKPIKATNNTTSAGWEEFIASGIVDGGEVDIEANFVPTEHISVIDLLGVTAAYEITWPTLPTPTTCTFDGIITEAEPTAPLEEQLKLALKIKVTGPVVTTA